jgi:hypothetical protein
MALARTTPDPRFEYQSRLDERQRLADMYAVRDGRISAARGIVFLIGIALLVAIFNTSTAAAWWLCLPAVLFVGLVVWHARVTSRLEQARAAVTYFQTGIARLEDNWSGTGADGARYADPHHPYSGDLDVFGRGSLFQLISRARTRLGEDALASWLSAPADRATIGVRQQAIDELRSHLDMREQLALLQSEVHDDLDQTHLLHWSNEPPTVVGLFRRVAAIVLAIAATASVTGLLFFGTSSAPLLLVLIIEIPFAYSFSRQIRHVAARVNEVGQGLEILAEVLTVLEKGQFACEPLRNIHTRLDTGGLPPSKRIAQLHARIERLNNCLRNQFFAPIAFLLGLPVHLVHSIEMWRGRYGSHISDWLTAVGELEALSALAGYAYEHPGDPFPELLTGEPLIEAVDAGHPLLARSECVSNDLSLGGELRLILISGSNMSGKSTMLRTIGTNVVLALAGAPVRAKQFRMSPLAIGTAMRVNDSLQEGKSFFYAAISRLKSIVDLAQDELPLLFLFDEILQGTNSHDRRIGTEAILSSLVEGDAIGLVTTHDLALTEIVEPLGVRAKNIHFEDRIEDGQMKFDYRIQPGVVKKSNALELMRMMGLRLDTEPKSGSK